MAIFISDVAIFDNIENAEFRLKRITKPRYELSSFGRRQYDNSVVKPLLKGFFPMRSFAEIYKSLWQINIMNGGGYELDRKEDLPQVIEALRIADTIANGGGKERPLVRMIAAGLNAGTFPAEQAETLRSALFAYDVKRAAKAAAPRHLGCPAPATKEVKPRPMGCLAPVFGRVGSDAWRNVYGGGGVTGSVAVQSGTSTATTQPASKPVSEALGRAMGVKTIPIVSNRV